ncbi:hypothetical protein BD410DRAFT_268081 [Rickenella mellea]|uniref:Uncharacterized protein n=1 Tax=Rickenella mellea TaxID=50990 RepID=A0A4Y7Q4L3_9AGAM|nr:hypothetical protein BD410DRAFT_268081 [Rickenella mellea]
MSPHWYAFRRRSIPDDIPPSGYVFNRSSLSQCLSVMNTASERCPRHVKPRFISGRRVPVTLGESDQKSEATRGRTPYKHRNSKTFLFLSCLPSFLVLLFDISIKNAWSTGTITGERPSGEMSFSNPNPNDARHQKILTRTRTLENYAKEGRGRTDISEPVPVCTLAVSLVLEYSADLCASSGRRSLQAAQNKVRNRALERHSGQRGPAYSLETLSAFYFQTRGIKKRASASENHAWVVLGAKYARATLASLSRLFHGEAVKITLVLVESFSENVFYLRSSPRYFPADRLPTAQNIHRHGGSVIILNHHACSYCLMYQTLLFKAPSILPCQTARVPPGPGPPHANLTVKSITMISARGKYQIN